MKKIKKEHWTGFNSNKKWKGDLQKAEQHYKEKGINLKKGFYEGWDLFNDSVQEE